MYPLLLGRCESFWVAGSIAYSYGVTPAISLYHGTSNLTWSDSMLILKFKLGLTCRLLIILDHISLHSLSTKLFISEFALSLGLWGGTWDLLMKENVNFLITSLASGQYR